MCELTELLSNNRDSFFGVPISAKVSMTRFFGAFFSGEIGSKNA